MALTAAFVLGNTSKIWRWGLQGAAIEIVSGCGLANGAGLSRPFNQSALQFEARL